MSTETEIKLSLSARVASELARHPLLADLKPHRQLLINTYYDTADSRLRKERIAVRYRQQGRDCLFAVKTAAQLSGGLAQRREWEVRGTPGTFDFSHVDDGRVRDVLESLRDQLQPLFTTRFTRQAWLFEPRLGARIEVALDRGWIEAAGRRQLIREVELELCEGTVSDLFDLASTLQATLPLHPEVSSKSERACRLLADLPMVAGKAMPVAVDAGLSSIAAFRLVALACVNHLQRNEQGVLQSDAPEFVHQARVAIRRLRSAIRVWQRHLPEAFVARFDPVWRELAQELGDARNWDVFLAGGVPALADALPEHVAVEQLRNYAQRRAGSCRRAARRALKAAAYSRLLVDFIAAVVALPEVDAGQVGTLLPGWLDKCSKRVSQRAADALDSGEDAARHRLRLAFKQLRYALEFFSSSFAAGPVLEAYHQSVTDLQELLGSQNDLAVATQLSTVALPAAKAAAIVGWLATQSESLLPELATSLAGFRQQPVPWHEPLPGARPPASSGV